MTTAVHRRSRRDGRRWTAAVLALAFLALAACGSTDGADGGTGDRPTVVVSTSVWGDVVANIVGDAAEVVVLMPPGTDAHDYQPSAQDVRSLREADLVVVNGLGLEEGLLDAVAAAEADGVRVLELAPSLDPLPPVIGDGHAEEDHGDEDGHDGGLDPHVWMDPRRVQMAVDLIAAALDDVVTDGPSTGGGFASRAADYAATLEELDRRVAARWEALDAERRRLVTDHAALTYYADRYGIDIVGTLVGGTSTLGAPDAARIADLIAALRSLPNPTVAVEVGVGSRVPETLRSEVPDLVVVEIYIASLGPPGSGAETYVDMIELDTDRLVDALGR